jgi:hypothetical protein
MPQKTHQMPGNGRLLSAIRVRLFCLEIALPRFVARDRFLSALALGKERTSALFFE